MTTNQTRTHVRVRLLSRALVVVACVGAVQARPLPAQNAPGTVTPADREAVRRAVLDYVEGFYEGDSVKLARSIRPEVYKYGPSSSPMPAA
jgi:predicted lipid-binding transport protein (Tim44 family)